MLTTECSIDQWESREFNVTAALSNLTFQNGRGMIRGNKHD